MSTGRALVGWEFGAGLGHVERLRPIAEGLRARGWEVVVALRDLDRAAAFLDPGTGRAPPGLAVVTAPRWPMPTDPEARKIPTHSFADVLNIIDYGAAGALAARIEVWAGLLRATGADLAIGDFCPTLRLAARGRVPTVMVGNGYTIPPAGRALPPIRPWQKALEPFSLEHEARLLEAANAVLARRGEPPLDFLADALNGDDTLVFSIPLVDPYAAYRTEPQLPPFNMPSGIRPLPRERRRPDGVFFYMPRGHPRLREAADAAKASGADCLAYVSDLGSGMAALMSGPGFAVSAEPLPFDSVIPEARLAVHHGGLSTAVACVLAGTPQLILPWNLEHLVTARRIETLGASVTVDGGTAGDRLAALVRDMPRDERLAERAAGAAGNVEAGDRAATLERALARCEAAAGRGG